MLLCAAAAPVLLQVLHHLDPVAAVTVAETTTSVGANLLRYGGLLTVLLLLVWPPFLPSLRIGLARLRRRLGMDPAPLYDALSRLEHLENVVDHRTVGRILRQQGNLARAAHHLQRALEMEPTDTSTRFELARVLASAGHHQHAALLLQSIVATDPGHAYGEATLQLALALERLGREEEASHALALHIARSGESRRALVLLGRNLWRRGKADEGRDLLRRAALKGKQPLSAEDSLWRARARVALWTKGML